MRPAFTKLPCWLALFAFSASGAAPPLPIPATGAYLGIWANPAFGGVEAAIQMREGPAPYGINRTFALHLHYYSWDGIAKLLNAQGALEPDDGLAGDIARGRVPVVSWSCDQIVFDSDRAIASGDSAEDAVITATARALAQYPGPVLLRWFWQFNLPTGNAGCRGETGAVVHPAQSEYDNFIVAWRRIWQLFQDAGASNVSFLWNPGYYSPGNPSDDPHAFYPGNKYVDWIGIDTYQGAAAAAFGDNIQPFYADFSQSQFGGKPLFVGENGALSYSRQDQELQASYLGGLAADFHNGRYPLLKGYDYFDSSAGAGSWVLDDNNRKGNGGLAAFTSLALSPWFAAPTPQFTLRGVVNAASNAPGELAPGSIATIYGHAFTLLTLSGSAPPLPRSMAGASVTFNGVAAPLFFVSPDQINVQVPFETAPGPVTIVAHAGFANSAALIATILPSAPGLFTFANNRAAAINADLSANGPDHPAKGGSYVSAWLTGQGASVTNPVPTGAAAPVSPLSLPTLPVTATVGGQPATVLGAALAPGFAGLLQVNLTVPNFLPGDYPLTVTIGQTPSNAATITIVREIPPPPNPAHFR